MKNIAVFCASSLGHREIHADAARNTGKLLASQGITLVYGGGRVGLMGVIADTVMQSGGKVIGVIPEFLASKEVAHQGLTELVIVASMHERKLRMSELCEGVIALPGGFGTLEELTEMLTWSQLNLHQKPIGILNTQGYYDHLEALFDQMVEEGLLKPDNRALAMFASEPAELLENMQRFEKPFGFQQFRKEKT